MHRGHPAKWGSCSGSAPARPADGGRPRCACATSRMRTTKPSSPRDLLYHIEI